MSPNQISDINAFFRRYNAAPLSAFSGLAPAQMHELLYDPWAPASPLRLRPALPSAVLDQIPFFRLTEELLRVVQRDGSIKRTAPGTLPGKYLHELYDLGFIRKEIVDRTCERPHYTGRRTLGPL